MTRLWAKIILKQRIHRQAIAECEWADVKDALTEICRELDIPRPLWLKKHETEFEKFRRTAFAAEHFMEEIPFDKLDIEFIDDTTRKSKDPRNEF